MYMFTSYGHIKNPRNKITDFFMILAWASPFNIGLRIIYGNNIVWKFILEWADQLRSKRGGVSLNLTFWWIEIRCLRGQPFNIQGEGRDIFEINN